MKNSQNEYVFITKLTGWINVFLDPEENCGTLVYVTGDTTVADIIENLKLSVVYTIWVQYHGSKRSFRLKKSDKPLCIQDNFLHYFGYDNASRRTRLETDPSLSNIIKFVIGPASDLNINRCGFVYVLKGLVLPQWRRRFGAIVADKFFLYSNNNHHSNADYDVISLYGATVKTEKHYKFNKYVIRIVTHRQVFFGFETLWERNMWKNWLLEASTTESNNKKLDLCDFGLEKIPKTVVLAWPQLEELVLSKNKIDPEDSSLKTILQADKLKNLSLSDTCLASLPLYITKLTQLEYLDVSCNFLSTLPREAAHLTSLVELNLDQNDLSYIPMIDELIKLRVLSVAYNNLTNDCLLMRKRMKSDINELSDKHKAFCDNLSIVNLKGNSLKGIIKLANYGNLTELDVSENSIDRLDLSSLPTLQCVRCSQNQLVELSLNGTELLTIIAKNNKLKTLIVNPLPTSLQHLDLSHNEFEVLPEWISRCNSLHSLAASHNCLKELPQDIFCNEECALATLQLSFNQLTVLPQIMRRVPIQRIFLQNNSIATLPRHFFIASSNLKILNVSKNCLKELPQFISKNEKLQHLYLTSNALTDVTSLLNCSSLKVLHIAYNAISSLPEGCVSAWSEMEELVISGNSLCHIKENLSNWRNLRIFRAHSNLLVSSPSFINNHALKILDLSYNYLGKIDLLSLIPKQMMYLDISGNTRLHVDSKQFHQYKIQRSINLVDVTGHNRNSLPFNPIEGDTKYLESKLPWTLGFSETTGNKNRLFVSQLRLPEFCSSEALIGICDTVDNNAELSKLFVKVTPRVLLEERTVKETASDYLKYTILSCYREIKDYCQQSEINLTLCHICKLKEIQENSVPRYVLRIASVGNTVSILCRNSGSLTLSPSLKQNHKSRKIRKITHTNFNLEPYVTEITLHDQDQFLLLANKSLWDIIGIEEAVAEVRSVTNPVLAAKRLQDLAQSYGSEENLSIMVLRFHDPNEESDLFTEEMHYLTDSNKSKASERFCNCKQNKVYFVERKISESERSSPSGQSDKLGVSRYNNGVYGDGYSPNNYQSYRKYSQALPVYNNNLANKCESEIILKDAYNNGNLADGEESFSDRSGLQVSEERFRCWEYMLEKNTQMLFDKELDTLSKSFTRRSVPSRPDLWSPYTKSVSHLPDCLQNAPFLSKRFGSARSYNAATRLDINRRSLNGGPNAAYFGSLQRLMPYNLEYNFLEIKEKSDNAIDSLELDGRMHKYWDVATTEL